MNIEYRGEEKVVVTASTRRLSEVHRVNMKTIEDRASDVYAFVLFLMVLFDQNDHYLVLIYALLGSSLNCFNQK